MKFYRSLLLTDNLGIFCHPNSASENVLVEGGDFGELGSAGVELLVLRGHDCAGAFGALICQDAEFFQAGNYWAQVSKYIVLHQSGRLG